MTQVIENVGGEYRNRTGVHGFAIRQDIQGKQSPTVSKAVKTNREQGANVSNAISESAGKEKPGAAATATGSGVEGFGKTRTTTHVPKYTNPKRDGQQFSERHKAFSRTAVYCLTDIEARGSANTLAFVAQKRLTRKERLWLTHALLQSLGDEDSELAVIEWARTYADMGVRV